MADLSSLSASGMDIDGLGDGEKAALSGLDQSEVDALAAIRSKLNAGDEVSGFAKPPAMADGIVIW